MTSFSARTAKYLVLIKAARQFRQEIEKAGLDNLKTLADAGISIVATYLNGCSPQEKKKIKRDLKVFYQMGITPDMVLTELVRQNPQLAPIMQGREDYKKREIQNLERFLMEG